MKKNWTSIAISMVIATSIFILPMENTLASTNTSITRTEVQQRALQMINLAWTYSSANNGNIDSKYACYVTKPKQFQNTTLTQTIGIPYNWGGLDGIDSNSFNTPWTNFLDAVNKGAYTGNVNSKGGLGLVTGTAGVDCSGFVQASFNIKDYKQSTTTLFSKYFTKINISDIKHMDILDKPGDHVVIFDKWGTQNGVDGAFTYEATPDQTYGGIMGTKQYFITKSSISKGYLPGRYVNITQDVPAATPSYVMVNSVYMLNIRLGALSTSQIIGTLTQGQYAIKLDQTADGSWFKISINGIAGWSYSKYLSYVK